MRIKKILGTVGLVGNVLNQKSSSKKDAYSCDYVNNLYQYCDIMLDSQHSLTFSGTQWETKIIPFNKLNSKQGDFSLENNGIKIGKGVSKVRITYGINTVVGTNRDTGFQLRKNGEAIVGKGVYFSSFSLVSDTFVLDVKEGDVLTLHIQNNWAESINIQLRGGSSPSTHMLVEKVG